ncbi:hypothetical protein niasHT_013213 [Heterodera trifolii]|uniref:Dynein heavy chain n=1 Tax=Heterodera trifolii TaxID=157864 RepID=A0ABD2KX96_9BILA
MGANISNILKEIEEKWEENLKMFSVIFKEDTVKDLSAIFDAIVEIFDFWQKLALLYNKMPMLEAHEKIQRVEENAKVWHNESHLNILFARMELVDEHVENVLRLYADFLAQRLQNSLFEGTGALYRLKKFLCPKQMQKFFPFGQLTQKYPQLKEILRRNKKEQTVEEKEDKKEEKEDEKEDKKEQTEEEKEKEDKNEEEKEDKKERTEREKEKDKTEQIGEEKEEEKEDKKEQTVEEKEEEKEDKKEQTVEEKEDKKEEKEDEKEDKKEEENRNLISDKRSGKGSKNEQKMEENAHEKSNSNLNYVLLEQNNLMAFVERHSNFIVINCVAEQKNVYDKLCNFLEGKIRTKLMDKIEMKNINEIEIGVMDTEANKEETLKIVNELVNREFSINFGKVWLFGIEMQANANEILKEHLRTLRSPIFTVLLPSSSSASTSSSCSSSIFYLVV